MKDPKPQPAPAPPTAKPLKTLPMDHQLGCARFSADGKLLAAGAYDATVRLWDSSGEELKPLPSLAGHSGWVDALTFHPMKPRLFTADTWGKLVCWDTTAEPKQLWSHDAAHDGWIRGLAVSSDGKQLASCGRDGVVRVWSVDDGKLLHELKDHREDVYSVAFHPTDHTLVSGDLKGVMHMWNLSTKKIARTFDASPLYKLDRIQDVGGARLLAFTRDGATLLCAGATPKGGGFVEASPRILGFDFKTGEKNHDITLGESREGFIYDLHEHPAGFLMLVTSGQPGAGRLMFLKLSETKPFFTATNMANCHALAAHPDHARIVVLATNANSNFNGRPPDKEGKYPANTSPMFVLRVEA